MSNNNDNFDFLAEETLNSIAQNIENSDKDYKLDIDFMDGVLKITTQENHQYVINKHSILKEMWISSPYSNAFHFKYNEETKQWTDKKGNNLYKMLTDELHKFQNIEVNFNA